MRSLTTRWPEPSATQLLAGFTPPPHFAQARFDTYLPQGPTQHRALDDLRELAHSINEPAPRRLFGRRQSPLRGRYLDGGYGVGKTHLLAALWHELRVPAAFGTFVGYTNLVGALGFQAVVEALSAFRVICIDEFELDDPGDTVLMSTLCTRLVERGVVLVATSNTVPDRLGEGRFAADDFIREIQGLAAHFDVVRIEGEDYRHRERLPLADGLPLAEVHRAIDGIPGATMDGFDALLAHLSKVHPSRYRLLLSDTPAVGITHAHTIADQSAGLRFVVFVDRLYDLDVEVYLHGLRIADLFAPELLASGYRKKYFRALSRLESLQHRA